VKQNRYILRKLIDAIKFCAAFELALRGHDEGVESNNPGIFRGLINLIAEVDDILKLHIDQSKNTVFTGTDMDIDSNKKVLGTIRIDPSVPSQFGHEPPLSFCVCLLSKNVQSIRARRVRSIDDRVRKRRRR
jgi:hypothetical protein